MILPDQIPEDLEGSQRLNVELIQIVSSLQEQLRQVKEELDLFKRKFFGRSSERHLENDGQLGFFEDLADPEPEPAVIASAVAAPLRCQSSAPMSLRRWIWCRPNCLLSAVADLITPLFDLMVICRCQEQ